MVLKSRSFAYPAFTRGALGPGNTGKGLGGASSTLPSWLLLLLCLTSAFSEPRTLLSHKINQMPLGVMFLGLGLPWVRVFLFLQSHPVHSQVFGTDSSSWSPSCPAHLGQLCAKSRKQSRVFFCQNALGLCQGQKTKPGEFCHYPVWHLLPSDPPHGV